jgi:CBS domain-containing protein
VALAVFNLLPGYPLDGGRLLRAAFWHRSGDLQAATARAANWGSGIAFGIMVLGGVQIFSGALVGGLWLIFIGMFLRGAAHAGYYGLVLDHALSGTVVRDLMEEPVTIPPEATVAEAIEDYFLRHGYTSFPVATGDTAHGLLTLTAVRQCPAQERNQRRVRDVMQAIDGEARIAIAPGATAADALRQMTATQMGRLLVVESGRLMGLLSRSTLIRVAQLRAAFDERVAAEPSDAQLDSAA